MTIHRFLVGLSFSGFLILTGGGCKDNSNPTIAKDKVPALNPRPDPSTPGEGGGKKNSSGKPGAD